MTVNLTKKDFESAIASAVKLAIIEFRTEWSGACQILDPIIETMICNYKDLVDFFSIDAEADKELSAEYGIQEYPTFLFFRNGQLIDHSAGLTSKKRLADKIEQALSATN